MGAEYNINIAAKLRRPRPPRKTKRGSKVA